jgi:hypothetical protein
MLRIRLQIYIIILLFFNNGVFNEIFLNFIAFGVVVLILLSMVYILLIFGFMYLFYKVEENLL